MYIRRGGKLEINSQNINSVFIWVVALWWLNCIFCFYLNFPPKRHYVYSKWKTNFFFKGQVLAQGPCRSRKTWDGPSLSNAQGQLVGAEHLLQDSGLPVSGNTANFHSPGHCQQNSALASGLPRRWEFKSCPQSIAVVIGMGKPSSEVNTLSPLGHILGGGLVGKHGRGSRLASSFVITSAGPSC